MSLMSSAGESDASNKSKERETDSNRERGDNKEERRGGMKTPVYLNVYDLHHGM